MYDHYVPGADRHADGALGVPHALHALPARDLPGRAAGDVRVPDRDLRADRAAGLQRLGVRGPERRRRRRLPGEAAQRPPHASSSARACTRTRSQTLRTHRPRLRHGGRRGARSRDGVTDLDAWAGRRSTPTRAPRSSRSRTSTARSRTPPRSAPPPRAPCDGPPTAGRRQGAPVRRSRRSTRSRSACSRRPATAASTSPSARARRSATASTSAGPRSASSPRARSTCGGCPGGSPARPSTSTAGAASC